MDQNYINDINSCHIPYTTLSSTARKIVSPCGLIFLENVMVGQLVKKPPAFYGTRGVITVYSTISHCILSRVNLIYSTSRHRISLSFILILCSHLCLYISSWISNRFAGFENLDADVDINRAWGTIRQTITISAKESLGCYELNHHKPSFVEGC
jgi:hypothetical protein